MDFKIPAIMIGIPHGIGDIIMINEVIERFWLKNNKTPIIVAAKKSVVESKLLDNAPWCVDQIVVPDIWWDHGLANGKIDWNTAFKCNKNDILSAMNGYNYDADNKYKINLLIQLGLSYCIPPNKMHRYQAACIDLYIECPHVYFDRVYISKKDEQKADEILNKFHHDVAFLWLVDDKEHWGEKEINIINDFAHKNFPHCHILNSRDYREYGINVCFALMDICDGIIVPESCWYHAANALHKNVDFVILNDKPDEWLSIILRKDIRFKTITLAQIKEEVEKNV